MEPEVSLTCSYQPTTTLYPEPDASIPPPHDLIYNTYSNNITLPFWTMPLNRFIPLGFPNRNCICNSFLIPAWRNAQPMSSSWI